MSHPILPITPHIAETVVEKKAPWKMSSLLARRMELKPFFQDSSFKKCPLLPSDPELEFVKRYFDQGKPSNLKIRRIYCLDNPASTKAFEGALTLMEAGANKKIFEPNLDQEPDSDRRKEVIGRWKRMGDLFGPFKVEDSEITQVKVFPLWHGGDFGKCLSIAASGFTFFGKQSFFDTRAEKGGESDTNCDRFGNGIYFTDSAKYASLYSPRHLLLSWVAMREPYPVIHDKPHPEKGRDMKILEGKESYQNYNAHYIPLASIDPGDPQCVDYYPCYDKQEATLDEFVVFQRAQAVARLWVELTEEGADPSYTVSEMMTSVEEGDLTQVQTWIEEDRTRLQLKTEEGETLCYAALSGNQFSLLKWLHEEDPSLIHHTRHDGRSLPFLAVLGGRREILHFLVDEGVSYSPSRFNEEAKQSGYSKNRIGKALESVNWSIWKIPPKTPYFSGRKDMINELRKRFFSDPSQSLTKVALVGLGGVGKSTLASAYAHEFQSRYSLVWWVKGEKSPRSGLKDLGIELGLVKSNTSEEVASKRALSYLNKNPGWLLIFDSIEAPSSLETLFPLFGKGHILITSRDTSWTNSLIVPSFSPQESSALLSKYTGYLSAEEEKKLAEEIGHLPLALAQAGSYMIETATSYESYLDLYLRERKELISSPSLPRDYPYSVAITCKISLDRLKRTYPESLLVLHKALYLGLDNIPKSILSEEGFSNLKLNNVLKALRNYNLLKTGEELETLSIHRLVQTTLRDYLSQEEAKRAKATLQEALKKEWYFDRYTPSTLAKAKALLLHLEAFSKLGVDEETAGKFLYDLGVYFQQIEIDLTRSIDFLTKSLEVREKLYGEGHPDVADTLSSLGSVCRDRGDLLKAIEFFERSLKVRLKVYGEEHPAAATILNNLGGVYQDRGDLSKAVGFYEKSLNIREKVYGQEHPHVANSLNSLGSAYKAQGNLSKAIRFYEKSLEISEKIYGKEHLHVSTILSNLGGAYKIRGDFLKAIDFYEKSLKISKSIYGEEHLHVAAILSNLGGAHKARGNLLKAIEFYEKSLEVSEKVCGEEHPHVANSLNNLGIAYQAKGDLVKAIEFYEKSLQISKKVYGEEHSHVANSLNSLASVYQAQGDLLKAIEFCEKSLQINKKIYGEEHLAVSTMLNNLGVAYQAKGDLPKGVEFYEKALQITKKIYGEEHTHVATTLNNLGGVYKIRGDLVKAIGFYEKALQIGKKVYGEEHADVATILNNLGIAYKAQGDIPKAIGFYEKSLKISRKVYGEEHPSIANSLNSLGGAYRAKGDLLKAIGFYEKSLQVNKKFYGEKHPQVVSSLHKLGTVYKAQGNPSQAIWFHEESLRIIKKLYGEEHEKTGEMLHVLASAYLSVGSVESLEKSEKFLNESLEILGKKFEDDHPKIKNVLSTLSAVKTKRNEEELK